ncbi:MAG: Gfo/Idh/MocA family protein, partial [Actinomycetota bacterium]
MVRYGIIGVGAMGREHAENLRYIEGATVTAISDPDEGSRNLALKQLGPETKVFMSHTELLNSGLVDAVIIATPNYTHVDVLK